MKLETFLEKFDLFADTPDAVSELRKIILHLAVRGALVDQSDNDEPAKVTLQRLTGRKLSFLDSVELPKAWGSVALGELLILQKGKKPSTLNTDRVGLPYLDIAALERGELRQFTEDEKCPRAASGDLVIVCDGSRSGLVLDGADGVLGSTVSKISHVGFFRDYLKLFLRSLYDDLNGAKKGAAIPHLNIPRFLAISAPIPPLAEQERIVAKVDELMALCDRLEVQQQEREKRHAALARASLSRFAAAPTPANLNLIFHPSYHISPADLRKAILTLAVQGKLVPQDPNDEPAETSSDTDSLFDLPSNWRWMELGSLGLCRTGRTPPTNDPENYGEGFPFIGPGQITPSGSFTAPEKTITNKGLERSTDAIASDILMVCIGGSIGKAAICRQPMGFNQQINSVRLKSALPEFVFSAMTAGYFQEQVRANASGSATPIINKGKWERIPVPIPPVAEQRRIVAKVEQLMAMVDALETQLAAGRAAASKLLAALVAELTGTKSNGKVPKPATAAGRRGRPRK